MVIVGTVSRRNSGLGSPCRRADIRSRSCGRTDAKVPRYGGHPRSRAAASGRVSYRSSALPVRRGARGAGISARLISASELVSPDLLTRDELDAVVLPYGPVFPGEARPAFIRYLKAGGSFLSTWRTEAARSWR
jgi:hypothetical protein